MNDMNGSRSKERGATLLLVTFVFTSFLIPMVGMTIDGAILYWVKAKLSAAVDASALATGRALNLGVGDQQQQTNALAVGQS